MKGDEEEKEEKQKVEKMEDYDERMQQRKDKQKKTGKKTSGREPKPPMEAPQEKDQYNFTDPESRIMKTRKKERKIKVVVKEREED